MSMGKEQSKSASSWSTPAGWIAFGISSIFFLFEFITRIEPGVATDGISKFYHLDDARFGILASLFFWVYTPMQIIVGVLLDRYGARKFVLLGSFVCAAGVCAFCATGNVYVAGVGRLMTGFGASFAFVSALWLVNHWFAPEKFALLSGGINAAGMLGTAVGSVVLSGLIEKTGWHHVFLATAGSGILIFLLALFFLKEPHSPATTATTAPGEHIRNTLAEVLGHKRTWAIAIAGLLYYMPVNVYGGLWGTASLIKDNHFTPQAAQMAISMIFWGMAAGSVGGGWLSDFIGHRKYLVFWGAVITGIMYAAAIYLPGTVLEKSVLLFLAGFFGGFQMLTFAMAKEGKPNNLVGTVVAFVNMIGIAGALIFQPAIGMLADMFGGNFRVALATIPVCALLAALVILPVSEYRHPDHTSDNR